MTCRTVGAALQENVTAGAQAAGAALKKCVLELGGSDAYIVLEDADIEAAARVCAHRARICGSVHPHRHPANDERIPHGWRAVRPVTRCSVSAALLSPSRKNSSAPLTSVTVESATVIDLPAAQRATAAILGSNRSLGERPRTRCERGRHHNRGCPAAGQSLDLRECGL